MSQYVIIRFLMEPILWFIYLTFDLICHSCGLLNLKPQTPFTISDANWWYLKTKSGSSKKKFQLRLHLIFSSCVGERNCPRFQTLWTNKQLLRRVGFLPRNFLKMHTFPFCCGYKAGVRVRNNLQICVWFSIFVWIGKFTNVFTCIFISKKKAVLLIPDLWYSNNVFLLKLFVKQNCSWKHLLGWTWLSIVPYMKTRGP